MANDSQQEKIHLFLEFAGMGQKDVPDPWYGDMTDFESVYHLLDKTGDEVVLRLEALLLKNPKPFSFTTFSALKFTLSLRLLKK